MNNPQRPTDAGCVEPLGYQCLLLNGDWSVVIYPHDDALAAVLNPNTLVSAMRPVFAAPTASGGDAAELAAADMREAPYLSRALLVWNHTPDDRVRPLLLAEASRRGARDWNYEDAENVIAFLLTLPLAKQEQS